MKTIRVTAAASLTVLLFAMAGQAALAGEWKGNDSGPTPINDYTAASICAFNGQDEPDHLMPGDEDDWLWGQTPAGGRVQSGGQIVATLGSAVVVGQGFAGECKPGGGGH